MTTYTEVSKPNQTDYMMANTAQGRQTYNDASITYDDPSIFYDSTNINQYTTVSKPSQTSYTTVTKPS